MIYGIGTDILALKRIERLYSRYGGALAKRVLAPHEQEDFALAADKVRFLAKRFAAKEAFAKAVGMGIREPVSLRHIGVGHDALGKPLFVCTPLLQQWLDERGISAVHLSLSDERDSVLAFAVAES